MRGQYFFILIFFSFFIHPMKESEKKEILSAKAQKVVDKWNKTFKTGTQLTEKELVHKRVYNVIPAAKKKNYPLLLELLKSQHHIKWFPDERNAVKDYFLWRVEDKIDLLFPDKDDIEECLTLAEILKPAHCHINLPLRIAFKIASFSLFRCSAEEKKRLGALDSLYHSLIRERLPQYHGIKKRLIQKGLSRQEAEERVKNYPFDKFIELPHETEELPAEK